MINSGSIVGEYVASGADYGGHFTARPEQTAYGHVGAVKVLQTFGYTRRFAQLLATNRDSDGVGWIGAGAGLNESHAAASVSIVNWHLGRHARVLCVGSLW